MAHKHRLVPCPKCEGFGTIVYEKAVPMSFSNPEGFLDEIEEPCEYCVGLGRVMAEVEDEDDDDATA